MSATTSTTAEEWFADHLERLQRDSQRRSRLSREKWERPGDAQIRELREYDAETDNLRRFLAGRRHDPNLVDSFASRLPGYTKPMTRAELKGRRP